MDRKLSLNDNALRYVREMVKNRDDMGLQVKRLDGDSILIDAGLRAKGGITAGLVLARISMGGLCEVSLRQETYGELVVPTIHVATDEPFIATMISQLPIPRMEVGDFVAMCSGPGKIWLKEPNWAFEEEDYTDTSKSAIFILQTDRLPDKRVLQYLASQAGMRTKDVYLIALSVGSLTGAVLVASMALEASMLRLIRDLGYSKNLLRGAVASCPMSPVYEEMWERPGVTPDDFVRYASKVTYFVEDKHDKNLTHLVRNLVVESLPSFGLSFYELLKSTEFSFEKLEEKGNVFASAQVTLYNMTTGRVHTAGRTHETILKKIISRSHGRPSLGFSDA